MQQENFIALKKKHPQNILYQCGISEVTLSDVLTVTNKDLRDLLPNWIIIPRLTFKQLQVLVDAFKITVPKKCPITRKAFSDLLVNKYDIWEKTLNNPKTKFSDLLHVFDFLVPFSKGIPEALKEIRERIRPLKPGNEVLVNWITASSTGFSPINKSVPGPQTHRMLITSWLHNCGLLHEKSVNDPRPTRVFSDNDSRTHCLHLRRDCGEDVLMLCKQMGWKLPPVFSDTGSAVYRRCDAVVSGNEYNTRLPA